MRLYLRLGLPRQQPEAQRRGQRDKVGDELRRPPGADQKVVDGMVDDGHAQKCEQAGRPQGAAVPHGAQDAAVHIPADHVHRAGAKAPDQQKEDLVRAVLREVADVFKGGKAGGHDDGGQPEAGEGRLKHSQKEQQRQQLHDLLHHRRDLGGGIDGVRLIQLGEEGVEIGGEQTGPHPREAEHQRGALPPF